LRSDYPGGPGRSDTSTSSTKPAHRQPTGFDLPGRLGRIPQRLPASSGRLRREPRHPVRAVTRAVIARHTTARDACGEGAVGTLGPGGVRVRRAGGRGPAAGRTDRSVGREAATGTPTRCRWAGVREIFAYDRDWWSKVALHAHVGRPGR